MKAKYGSYSLAITNRAKSSLQRFAQRHAVGSLSLYISHRTMRTEPLSGTDRIPPNRVVLLLGLLRAVSRKVYTFDATKMINFLAISHLRHQIAIHIV